MRVRFSVPKFKRKQLWRAANQRLLRRDRSQFLPAFGRNWDSGQGQRLSGASVVTKCSFGVRPNTVRRTSMMRCSMRLPTPTQWRRWTKVSGCTCETSMRAIDTKVLVGLIVRDAPDQVERAEAFVAPGAWVSQRLLGGRLLSSKLSRSATRRVGSRTEITEHHT